MIKIETDIGNFGNDISKHIRNDIENDLRSVVCSEHGKRVHIKWKSQSKKNMDFSLDACCDQLAEKALAKLD